MTGWHTLYRATYFPIHFRMHASWYEGENTVTKSSRFAEITSYPISAKSHSSILFKHRKRSRPSSNLYVCVPSYYSADCRTKKRTLVLNHSYIHRELSSLFTNRYIPGPHIPFSVHFSRWWINTCIIIDLSSMIPLISASS